MRLFDLHCDTLYECYQKHEELAENLLHVDLKRGLRWDAWAQVFAVWMPDGLRGEAAWQQCCTILDLAERQAAKYAERLQLVRNPAQLEAALAAGRCAALLGVEGGSALAGKLEHVDLLAQRGVKIITLTWNGANELGSGVEAPGDAGLTPFGRAAVKRMERAGILPDVSHLNEQGFWDVAETAEGPFIASHSVSAALNDHPRNLTDRQFCEIRDRGGLVGINLCASQLGEQTFECVERHIDHYVHLDGARTVAFGCDLDGTDLPEKWGGIQVMEQLWEHLARKNYEETFLDRLFFGNCYDFFRAL